MFTAIENRSRLGNVPCNSQSVKTSRPREKMALVNEIINTLGPFFIYMGGIIQMTEQQKWAMEFSILLKNAGHLEAAKYLNDIAFPKKEEQIENKAFTRKRSLLEDIYSDKV